MTSIDTAPDQLGRLDETGRALLFTQARTAHTFSSQPVTDEQLAGIWDLAKWAPTSANVQPLRVLFVRTEEGRQRVVKHMTEENQAQTAQASAIAVLAVDTEYHEYIPTVFPIIPGMRDMFAADNAMRTATGEFNATLQAGYFILSVRAEGLAAGPMKGFDPDGVDAEFYPDGRFKTILIVNIGHPGVDAWGDRLPRLGDDDVVRWA